MTHTLRHSLRGVAEKLVLENAAVNGTSIFLQLAKLSQDLKRVTPQAADIGPLKSQHDPNTAKSAPPTGK
jgi:hypothetical protein